MRRNRGFFLVYELICFGFSALLLAHTAQCLTASLKAQEQALRLLEAWQAGQLAALGQELSASYVTEVEFTEQNGFPLVEVSVYDAECTRPLCSLVQHVP